MASWYAAPDGNDANSGATWALRKLTITSLVGVAFAAGDRLLVAPGVYRERVPINLIGGATVTSAGTVSVTNESTAVVGVGTAFAGAQAGDQFFIGNFEAGVNGITNGTAAFTLAAGGNFQAAMVGRTIEIMTKGAYVIGGVGGVGAITLVDQNGIGWPAAGAALDYYVVSGEGPYEIASITDATNLTLNKPWSGPTLTGLTFEIYRPVYLIGDVTGIETDGVGGVVRLTTSNNDATMAQAMAIELVHSADYWVFRGFQLHGGSVCVIRVNSSDFVTLEDCTMVLGRDGIKPTGTTKALTARRNIVLGGESYGGAAGVLLDNYGANTQTLIENVYFDGNLINVRLDSDPGGVTVKNITNGFGCETGVLTDVLDVGNCVHVHDSKIHNCNVGAFDANVLGEIIEQHNNLAHNAVDYVGATTANTIGNSTGYPHLPQLPLLTGRARNPMTFFTPSQWDATRRIAAGVYPKNEDLFGVMNEVAQTRRSRGCFHNYSTLRSATQSQGAFAASLYMEDAMQQQFVYPVQEGHTYNVSVWVYLEANYAGGNPQMIVRRPGEADIPITSSGAIGAWEQLATAFTAGAEMDWVTVVVKSRNTANLANIGVYWQDARVI